VAVSDTTPLRPPTELPGAFQWRQEVSAQWPTGTQSFEAVLLRQGQELKLVGLSAMGQPGFVLTLHPDASVSFENHTRRELPFPPEFILGDVQRVFYPWLAGDPPGTGERTGHVAGLKVTELWRGGRLEERHFERETSATRERVVVRYEGWRKGLRAPARAVLHNEHLDYTLTIETLEQTPLPVAP
jgi:hypothetical protein